MPRHSCSSVHPNPKFSGCFVLPNSLLRHARPSPYHIVELLPDSFPQGRAAQRVLVTPCLLLLRLSTFPMTVNSILAQRSDECKLRIFPSFRSTIFLPHPPESNSRYIRAQ